MAGRGLMLAGAAQWLDKLLAGVRHEERRAREPVDLLHLYRLALQRPGCRAAQHDLAFIMLITIGSVLQHVGLSRGF